MKKFLKIRLLLYANAKLRLVSSVFTDLFTIVVNVTRFRTVLEIRLIKTKVNTIKDTAVFVFFIEKKKTINTQLIYFKSKIVLKKSKMVYRNRKNEIPT